MAKTWSYEPNELSDGEYIPRQRKKRQPSWKAPEHVRITSDMVRAHPLDKWGKPRLHLEKELVVDPRPQIMLPERKVKRPF
jgi:hypothetical protein